MERTRVASPRGLEVTIPPASRGRRRTPLSPLHPWSARRSEASHPVVARRRVESTSLRQGGSGAANGRGDTPNRHDILTGSQADGRAFPAGDDRTCRNWTSSTQGAAMVGHHDRQGLRDDEPSKSWNTSHPSRGPDGGCSQADLRSTVATACSTASPATRQRTGSTAPARSRRAGRNRPPARLRSPIGSTPGRPAAGPRTGRSARRQRVLGHRPASHPGLEVRLHRESPRGIPPE
jgi:hypothetical protein